MTNWRPVVGFEAMFSVSDEGEIARTSLSWHGKRRRPIWRLLRPDLKPNGYLAIYLQVEGKKRKRCYVHRLVFEAFRSAIPDGLEINHINGNPSDNRLKNLELITRSEKMKHRYREMEPSRNRSKGADHYKAKLTVDDVHRVLAMAKEGITHKAIAAQFGIGRTAITSLVNGKSWKSVTSP